MKSGAIIHPVERTSDYIVQATGAVAKIGMPWVYDDRGITYVPPRYAAKASPGICLWDDMQTGVGSKGGAVSASPSLGRFFFPYSF